MQCLSIVHQLSSSTKKFTVSVQCLACKVANFVERYIKKSVKFAIYVNIFSDVTISRGLFPSLLENTQLDAFTVVCRWQIGLN